MINKQTATLSLQLLSVMDKLFTLAPQCRARSSSSLGTRITAREFCCQPSNDPGAGRARDHLCRQSSLGYCFVELLRGDDVAVCASLQQRAVEPVAKPARFIDDMDFKAFSQPRFDPGHEFRGSKTLRRARRSVVILSHHDEFLPMDVESNLEQRAAPLYSST